ncbi:MAG: S-methyl-5-thioribose-1-phosphate isomerase [Rickettsiales bacterium]|nr:S-methyl-5-thioribose-1-phosphate isomerase [Rickettsiales bacterium]|tara:strand:+ start:272 stop:1342 length:1071 start_codon:yes stop_codon:yes gene_type:complete
MKVKNKKFSTIWVENRDVKIIDQTKLPFKFKVEKLQSLNDFCKAIEDMKVRGAPLIGVTAAFGFAKSIEQNSSIINIKKCYDKLLKTRPTAINLKWALDTIKEKLLKTTPNKRASLAIKLANLIRDDDIKSCKKIGHNGLKIIEQIYKKKKKPINILTHCNAGWLATVDYGTALSPIFYAHQAQIPLHIWVDETRPRNQGALLTSWELYNEKIPHTVIVDNAGGHLMQKGKVDLCLVGSDRTAMNGDVCNKIGTYLKAISAHENNIPFYVALPTSTIDRNLKKGSDIPIETRDGKELSNLIFEKSKKLLTGRIYKNKTKTFNPAFDVTPSKFITALITENGICKANCSSIKKKLKK